MVEECGGPGHSGGKVTAVRHQSHGAEHQRDGEGARRGLVFESQHRGPGNERAQRADRRHQQRRSEAESQAFGHQEQAPDAERARDDLLRGEHFAEASARDGAKARAASS